MMSIYVEFRIFAYKALKFSISITGKQNYLFAPQQNILLHSSVYDFVLDGAKSIKEEGFKEKPLWWLKSSKIWGKKKDKKMVQLRPRAITVDRGSRGFGLSLIYRGLDKYEEKDTGIFVARVVPGGKIHVVF